MNGFNKLHLLIARKQISHLFLCLVSLTLHLQYVLFCRLSTELSCRVYSLQILWKLKKLRSLSELKTVREGPVRQNQWFKNPMKTNLMPVMPMLWGPCCMAKSSCLALDSIPVVSVHSAPTKSSCLALQNVLCVTFSLCLLILTLSPWPTFS